MLLIAVNMFLSSKTSDNAVSRETKIPVWTEEEGAVRNGPVPSALTVLHRGARPPASCVRDEGEGCVSEGEAQGRHPDPHGHEVSKSPCAATLAVAGASSKAPDA